MGRRALRRLNPQLDLSTHLRHGEAGQALADPASWFTTPAPLELEVGSGKGLFLWSAAVARPEHNFVGIELARKYAHYAAARLARHQLPNAVVLEGDGVRFFQESVRSSSVRAVHVYFPDPWWKKRHKKRRVMNVPFVRDVERVLESGGRLHFWTDVEEYFQTTVDLLRTETGLAGPLPVPERPAEHDLDYRTHFERRTRLQDQPVYRSEFVKNP